MTESKAGAERWRNRIIGHGEEDPAELTAHPKNWRAHPENQRNALTAILDEVGFVQDVIVNKRTGRIVDGHLRVSVARERGEETIPVVYVDLTESEEALILATLDPIGAMAQTNQEAFREALDMTNSGEAALQEVTSNIAEMVNDTLDDAGITFDSYSAPTQDKIDARSEEMDSAFKDKSEQTANRMVDLICPECSAEFSILSSDLLKSDDVLGAS